MTSDTIPVRFSVREPSDGAWFDLGSGTMPVEFRRGELHVPLGIAYFCGRCGDVWARASIPGRPFGVHSIPCEAHDPGWLHFHAGSLWLDWDTDLNNALPRAALLREIQLIEAKWARLGLLDTCAPTA